MGAGTNPWLARGCVNFTGGFEAVESSTSTTRRSVSRAPIPTLSYARCGLSSALVLSMTLNVACSDRLERDEFSFATEQERRAAKLDTSLTPDASADVTPTPDAQAPADADAVDSDSLDDTNTGDVSADTSASDTNAADTNATDTTAADVP